MKKRIFTLLALLVVVLALTVTAEEKPLSLEGTKWKLVGYVDAETGELEKPDYSMVGSCFGCFPSPSNLFPNLSTDDWFTLEFQPVLTDSNSCLSGCQYYCKGKLTSSHIGSGEISVVDFALSTIDFGRFSWMEVSDAPEGERYYRALENVNGSGGKFELTDTSMKIYYFPLRYLDTETWQLVYSEKLEYMLFTPWEPAPSKVLAADRIIPQPASEKEFQTAALAPEIMLSSNDFAAGPNPVAKSAGLVNFYRVGKQIKSASLKIYNASGKSVAKIGVSDKPAVQGQSKCQVGSWNLKDAKGRSVSDGAYLVKGTVKTVDGRSEKISLIISVR
jgi:hypothetical protein